MGNMEKEKQTEIQIQCQKDWSIYQVIQEDKKEGTIIYGCPSCGTRYLIVPIVLDYSPTDHNEISDKQVPTQQLGSDTLTTQEIPQAKPKKLKRSKAKL